jgi:hypothetical protein
MNQKRSIVIFAFLFAFAIVSAQQNMPVLYDSKLVSNKPVKIEARVLTEISKAAIESQKEVCSGKALEATFTSGFKTKMSGSFIRAKTNQVAYIVAGCFAGERNIFYLAPYESTKMLGFYRLSVPGKLREAIVPDISQR